jgi:4,4'-diaponeurosporenoate glycosyltransferase
MLGEKAARGGVVSVQPWHEAGSAVEKLSSLFNIVAMAAMNAFTALGDALPPAGCFGPCILCGKTDYIRAGGHRAVRASVLEDVELGRRFLGAGIAVHCFGGRNAVRFRMYTAGITQQVEGWTKNMARGAAGTHPAVLAGISLWFTGLFSAAFFGVRWGASGAYLAAAEAGVFYLLYCTQLFWMMRKAGNFGALSALLYPLHLLFFLFVFLRSLVLTYVVQSVSWKGRLIAHPGRPGRRGD